MSSDQTIDQQLAKLQSDVRAVAGSVARVGRRAGGPAHRGEHRGGARPGGPTRPRVAARRRSLTRGASAANHDDASCCGVGSAAGEGPFELIRSRQRRPVPAFAPTPGPRPRPVTQRNRGAVRRVETSDATSRRAPGTSAPRAASAIRLLVADASWQTVTALIFVLATVQIISSRCCRVGRLCGATQPVMISAPLARRSCTACKLVVGVTLAVSPMNTRMCRPARSASSAVSRTQ